MSYKSIIVILAIGPPLFSQERAPKALTVCEVLSKLGEYRGKQIVVRGELIGGYHGGGLRGEGCPPLTTDGYTWPSPVLIALTPPGSRMVENPSSPAPIVRVEPFDEAKLKNAGPEAKVHVTVVGRLETRLRLEIIRSPNGKSWPYGYGHLNACPAQIVYEEIRDHVIVSSK
jgi:hypothetical protein